MRRFLDLVIRNCLKGVHNRGQRREQDMSNPNSIQSQTEKLMSRAFALVNTCPVGKVTTYSWLARALGYPRGARMLGWFMNEATQDTPAQRVLNSKGELSGSWAFGAPDRMRQLLEAEGVSFLEDARVDLKKYGWNPDTQLTETEREQIFAEADLHPVSASRRLLYQMEHDVASPLRVGAP
jgi:methylated-DNA-protein-cysteine methyltransferase related protein